MMSPPFAGQTSDKRAKNAKNNIYVDYIHTSRVTAKLPEPCKSKIVQLLP